MSLGLRLLARLSAPSLEPDRFMERIERWVRHRYSEMLPRTRRGLVERSPALFCQLHPAAEDLEISLIDPTHLLVSANTTTVGPGYHIFVTSLLKDWAREFNASWEESEGSSEDYGDETGYFFTGNAKHLYDEMSWWLKAVANIFFDGSLDADAVGISLCMPMNPHFETEQPALTALGPRDREWLYETAQDGSRGKDFFAWWTSGLNAEYYLGRALTHMWSNVRWRSPANDAERLLLEDVADSLHRAYQLDSSLQYPWAEWKEILELLDVPPEDMELVNLYARGQSMIGYRRRDVIVSLPGAWRMTVPGTFSDFEPDDGNDLCAVDPPREIWFTAYRLTDASAQNTFESMMREMKESRSEYLIERNTYISRATITNKHRETGEDYFILSSSTVSHGARAVCTVVFSEAEQKDWALETWRSIEPPSSQES